MGEQRVAIVGVGNVLMGDDGVGPAAVELLRGRGLQRLADLYDAGLAFAEVLCELDPFRPLIVLDAARGGGPAGSIYRLSPAELETPAATAQSAVSLHETSVLPALQMAALAGRAFDDVTIFGVEPARLEWGRPLSPAVRAAVEELAQTICEYVNERVSCGGQAAPA